MGGPPLDRNTADRGSDMGGVHNMDMKYVTHMLTLKKGNLLQEQFC